MTRIFHRFFMWKMDPISGFDIRLGFTLPPRDSSLQYKRCVQFWNIFPCITSLVVGKYINIMKTTFDFNLNSFQPLKLRLRGYIKKMQRSIWVHEFMSYDRTCKEANRGYYFIYMLACEPSVAQGIYEYIVPPHRTLS